MDAQRFSLSIQAAKNLLLGQEKSHLPFHSAFEKWVRRIKGVKLPDDIKEDFLRELFVFKFLCDQSFFFYALLTNQLGLYYEYVRSFEKRGGHGQQVAEKNHQHYLNDVWSSTMKPIHTTHTNLLVVEVIEAHRMQLLTWMMLSQQLQDLTYRHQVEVRHHRAAVLEALAPILEEMSEDIPDFSVLWALLRHDFDQIAYEASRDALSFDALNASAETVTVMFNRTRQRIFEFMDSHQAAVANYRDRIEDIFKQYDETILAINHHYDGLKAIVASQCLSFTEEEKRSKKELIEGVDRFVSKIEQDLNKGTSSHSGLFDVFHEHVSGYLRAIDEVTLPEQLQRVLNDCAQGIGELASGLNESAFPETVIDRIKAVQEMLSSLANQKPIEFNIMSQPEMHDAITSFASEIKDQPTPEQKTTSMREQASQLRETHQSDQDLFQTKMTAIKNLWEQAKTDQEDPLELDEADEKMIDALFHQLEDEKAGIDLTALDALSSLIKKVRQSNTENTDCKKLCKCLYDLRSSFGESIGIGKVL